MTITPVFGNTEHAEGGAGGRVLANLAYRWNEARTITSVPVNTPGSTNDGDLFIVGSVPAGDFSTFSEYDMALYVIDSVTAVGAWHNRAPVEGTEFSVKSGSATWAGSKAYFNGTAWVERAGGGGSSTFVGLSDTPGNYTGDALKVARVNAGETALEFATVSGTGDVVGPASATANALARFDATTGKLIQDSAGVLDDAGALTGVTVNADVITAGTLAHERGGLESDVSAGDGFVEIKGGNATVVKSNTSATVAPSATDDTPDYAVGSRWIDTTADKEYVCLDATSTAAVWTETTGAGGGGDTHPIVDSTAIVSDPVDSTKLVRVDAGLVATGTTRVLQMADENIVLTPNGSFAAAAHAARHASGGADPIKLDDLGTPDDNTDLNATTGVHGLLPKLGGGSTNFLRADGTWDAPAGGGSSPPFTDSDALVKGSADDTRLLRFEVDAISPSTTRIITVPDEHLDLSTDNSGSYSSLPVPDTTAIAHGSGDSTKRVQFEVDAISPSTTRIVTFPDEHLDLSTDNSGSYSNLPVPDTTALVHGSANSTRQVRMEVDQVSDSTTRVITMPDANVDLGDIVAGNAAATRKAIFFAAPSILEYDQATTPGSPSDGDAYHIAAGASGAFSTRPNQIARFTTVTSAWEYFADDAMHVQVRRAATHDFKGARLAYSSDEDLWYPLLSLHISTEHWTGRYARQGTTKKVYRKSFTGNLDNGSPQAVAHGVTGLDTANSHYGASGYLDAGTQGVSIPQNFAGVVFDARMNATNLTMTYPTLPTSYQYVVDLEYTKT